jgi:CheY-like chemotaxis protein
MASILVIDDNPKARKPLMKLLKSEGYRVTGASNSLEALTLARRSNPDLVLLDVMLPPMDGLTFLMLLREEPAGRETPVILLTGLSDPHTVARAKELGVKAHLVKSHFEPEYLLELVRKYTSHDDSASPPEPLASA